MLKYKAIKWSNFSLPWMTFLSAPLLIAYLYACIHPELFIFYRIPAEFHQQEYQWVVIAAFLFLLVIDTFHFSRCRRRYDQRMHDYEQQRNELLKKKSKLQNKAHQYSAHADKLKMFISERLLEHIEYDEKFLHFRNIASEVRHNGVICYDKVTISLNTAIKRSGRDNVQQQHYHDALDRMSYLWDLLDLSTTDNIPMYIANKLYEAEEQYYQQMLTKERTPFSPTFSMRHAVVKMLMGYANDPDPDLVYPDGEETYHYVNDRFVLEMESVGEMLGNENYVVLMLENLVNNALYYCEQKKYKDHDSRIIINLRKEQGQAKLSVYNRGPHIDDEIRAKLFQLGFSTKRVRENNGKGLGLYFVNEIVKGYEGKIAVNNVSNPGTSYLLTATLSNGDQVTHTVIVDLDDKQRPVCRNPENGELRKGVRFRFKEDIRSLEVRQQSDMAISRFVDIKGDMQLTDTVNHDRPCWRVEIKHNRNGSCIDFKPLDISGVTFVISMPTALSRLGADYHDVEENEFDDLGELDKEFNEVKAFVC